LITKIPKSLGSRGDLIKKYQMGPKLVKVCMKMIDGENIHPMPILLDFTEAFIRVAAQGGWRPPTPFPNVEVVLADGQHGESVEVRSLLEMLSTSTNISTDILISGHADNCVESEDDIWFMSNDDI